MQLKSAETLAVRLAYTYLDLPKAVAFLPENSAGEIEVSALQNTEQIMRFYAEAVEMIEQTYFARRPDERIQTGQLYTLLQNCSHAASFLADGAERGRTLHLTSSDWETVDAMRNILLSLKTKAAEVVYNCRDEDLSGIDLPLLEFETFEELLHVDPQIQALFRILDDYVYERQQNQ